jgi:hypothetical protein
MNLSSVLQFPIFFIQIFFFFPFGGVSGFDFDFYFFCLYVRLYQMPTTTRPLFSFQ